MSAESDLAHVQRTLHELRQQVRLLRVSWGDTLGIRRVSSDVERLVTDLEEIGEPARAGAVAAAPSGAGAPGQPELEVIEDRDYDPAFWEGADTEGLGAADRHAP